jgi:Fur family peroxide stress response transcriptional regulator
VIAMSPRSPNPSVTPVPATALTMAQIQALLRDKGLRPTPQRYAVYANLLGRYDHPTVEQILHDISEVFPMSSRATVYNTLTALREQGLVREVLLQEGVTRYDANTSAHHHFVCNQCGSIHDLPWQAFPQMPNPNALDLTAIAPDLQPETYEVIVRGSRCPNCVTDA